MNGSSRYLSVLLFLVKFYLYFFHLIAHLYFFSPKNLCIYKTEQSFDKRRFLQIFL
ncbi:hypothetical protein HMPREF0020_00543 [Acinetobacter baumannii 6013113]|nr:hypothetical protein HMPREF0020_00543 [Acinetobacter baumannii 6013113]